ncbi:RNA-directed DNA polymerase, eukaryota [Tanacetum coccineum]|uniref:RNA-directed DNA polymerase, eukaryota n=1 Tax=Tanacetum coccineum TaxID=301880 RepID=A0ABQ4WY85_9ASTR
MGINVESAQVIQAATKLGCLVLKCPFYYLGTRVGGSMTRVQAWQEIVEKVKSWLSKWKSKTLSIGGRLTLLKSVLGSIPVFHMSIFKVPSKVLHILESIRSHFFNGHDPGSKKASWVKWNNVLTDKKRGGLGVSSLFALNRGLMIKWVWKFLSQKDSLWTKVIVAIHGVGGKIHSEWTSTGKSCWLSILSEVRSLQRKGMYVFDYLTHKMGNGESTKFWLDHWHTRGIFKDIFPRLYALESSKDVTVSSKIGDTSLVCSFRRIPRGGIEQNQFDSLVELVRSVTIVPSADRWNWNLESTGIFSVASARRRIDEICLPNIGEETRWVKCVPIKINVLAWKIKTDALPTRFNISRRGIDIQDMSCPICDNAIESTDHLFFRCGLVRDIANKVLSWWNLDHANLNSYAEWKSWLVSIRMDSKLKKMFEGVWYSIWWAKWDIKFKYSQSGKDSHHINLDSENIPAKMLDDLHAEPTKHQLLFDGVRKNFESLTNWRCAVNEVVFDNIDLKYMGDMGNESSFNRRRQKRLSSNVGIGTMVRKRLQQASTDFFVEGGLAWDLSEKKMLWDYLSHVIAQWASNAFNLFISNAGLEEVSLGGCSYTWCHKSASKMSKLDRFLISESLMNSCPNISAITLERFLSDHRPILMRESHYDYGPVPFRFFHYWFEIKGFDKFLKILGKKAVVTKGCGDVEIVNKRANVVRSLQELENLQSLEAAQKSKIKWAIEGDENSKYYHGILNKKRSQLAIRGILVNDSRLQLDLNFPNTLQPDQIIDLECDVSKDEIKRAVWDCGTDKSPGPDGFTFGFYRRYWNILESDVVDAVMSFFFHYGQFSKGNNSSFIALIPKTRDANMVKDFRPISLIGSMYKIIAKILANRLVLVLGDLVNEVQSAFIADRQILDGPFILNEIVQWCQSKRSSHWGSVIVNGSPTEEFQFHKGLKQGDPLSPFLFILVMETLHISFQRIVDAGMFKGLRLNMSKSKLMGIYVDADKVAQAARKIGCVTLKTPFTYLGSKVGGHMSRIQSWNETIEAMASRLSKWNMKTLSIGGRLTLLKSVLGSMPIYHMSIFKVPMKILQRMESIRSHFFNGSDPLAKKPTWVKWTNVLASKEKGGLGISSLYALNRALMFKWVWRFLSQNSSLWANVIKSIHGDHGKIGKQVKVSYPSIWLDIVKEVDLLKKRGLNLLSFVNKKVGNGSDTLFWEETWHGDVAFKFLFPRAYALESCKNIDVASKLSQNSLAFTFRREPRGGVEQDQFDSLKAMVEGTSLVNIKDRWIWSLQSSGDFTVRSIRKLIDVRFTLAEVSLSIVDQSGRSGSLVGQGSTCNHVCGREYPSAVPVRPRKCNGCDFKSITSLKCVLTQEHLDAICANYFVPEKVHPQLPSSDATMHERPAGKVGMYTRFFDYANYRIQFSTFFVSVLTHFRILFSQLSVFGSAKFLILKSCAAFAILILMLVCSGISIHTIIRMVGLVLPNVRACYSKNLDSVKNWNDHFFWVDEFVVPANARFGWFSGTNIVKDRAPAPSEYNVEHVNTLIAQASPFLRFPEEFLCWVGISRNYLLNKDTYPRFEYENGEGGSYFPYTL